MSFGSVTEQGTHSKFIAVYILEVTRAAKSFVQEVMRNKTGPNSVLWGTPDKTEAQDE